MKKAAVLSFSERGSGLAQRIAACMSGEFDATCLRIHGDLSEVTGRLFPLCDAIVFVGAAGIAVRAIAPYVVSKTSDPAVLVIDERGQHVISLLSGHIGGANELTERIASAVGADPVITTATDVNGRFSVDAWAAKQGLAIDSMELAKTFSAAILQRDLPLYSELPVDGTLPAGLFFSQEGALGAAVSYRRIHPFHQTLRLIPGCLHLGVGCRRGTDAQALRRFAEETLEEYNIDVRAVVRIASIDVKQDEQGLLEFARQTGVPAVFYSAEQLRGLEGEFTASPFVNSAVGVDNVCERSAMLSAGQGGTLIIKKTADSGMTLALAQEDRRICFE